MKINWKRVTELAIKYFVVFFFVLTAIYFISSKLAHRTSFDWDAFTKFYISFFPPALTVIITISIFYIDRRNQAAKNLEFSKEVLQELKKHQLKLSNLSHAESDLRFITDDVNQIYSHKVQYLYKNGLLFDLDSKLFDCAMNFTYAKDGLVEYASHKIKRQNDDSIDKKIREFAMMAKKAIDDFENRVTELCNEGYSLSFSSIFFSSKP